VRFFGRRLHPPAGEDEGEDDQRRLEVDVQRQAPPLGGGRPQGDEGAVAVGDAGAERDQRVHVRRAVPGGGPRGAVDVAAGPELHDGGDDEDRRHQPVHRVEVERHVHQHHQAQAGGEGDLPPALQRGQVRRVVPLGGRGSGAAGCGVSWRGVAV
jgi:hypothetical protein